MEELKAKLDKLLADAEDYELIAQLATDPARREAFNRLAVQTRDVADKLRGLMAQATSCSCAD